jgi:hypothetical protein
MIIEIANYSPEGGVSSPVVSGHLLPQTITIGLRAIIQVK